ncbi:Methionine--tRNA ligase [Dirofilaria immitis]
MWHRFVLFLLTANILHISLELGINHMDFCCSNTCCCSSCTAEQCQLPDQPGKQCRCYNTTSVTCLRFRNAIYKPESIIRSTNREITDKIQIFPVLPEQSVMSQIVPMGIAKFDTDPLCCVVGNCPAWIKCKYSSTIKRNQSTSQSMPMPLFIVACILFALIIITTIGLCIAASLYISDSHKRRSCNVCDRTERY